ncbi:biotin synthase [Streptococcus pneumoniae]|nr:biotin synthase [Streptococcus pneumoniae]
MGDSLVFVGGILSLHFLAGMAFEKALAVGVLPFIIPDLGKLLAISFISRPLLQRLKNQAYFTN